MIRRALWGMALTVALVLSAAAQEPTGYLDVFIAKAKPEKRAEFDAINKKIAEANRKNNGDTWVASETEYGEGNVVTFVSTRTNYADVGKGMEAFFGAIAKAAGSPAGAQKLFQEFNNTISSSRGEIRRRRPDLSANIPSSAAAQAKLVGESRWLRTIEVHVRPGRTREFEEEAKAVKAALEKVPNGPASYASQTIVGGRGNVYRFTTFRKSLADFDAPSPTLEELMGAAAYQKFQKVIAETTLGTEVTLNRFLPEISNPPADVASAAPDFWHPKPKPAAKPAAKSEGAPPAAAKKPAAKKKE